MPTSPPSCRENPLPSEPQIRRNPAPARALGLMRPSFGLAVLCLLSLASSPALAITPPETPSLPPGVSVVPPAPQQPSAGNQPLPGALDDNGKPFVISDARFHRVVTPEMQAVLATMLPSGPNTFLPEGATIRDVSLQHETIEIAIDLPSKAIVRYELKARIKPPSGQQSRLFTIRRLPDDLGDLPGLHRALIERLRQHEAAFAWREVRAHVTFHRSNEALQRGLKVVDEILRSGRPEKGKRQLVELISKHRPEDIEILQLWEVAIRLLRAQRLGDARAWLKQIVAQCQKNQLSGPLPISAWRRYAGALKALGENDKARQSVKECAVRKSKPIWACGLIEMAQVATLSGAQDEATRLLKEAIGDGVGRPLSLLLRQVKQLQQQGDVEAGRTLARLTLSLHPKAPEATRALASAETLAGDPAEGLRRWLAISEGKKPLSTATARGIMTATNKLHELTKKRKEEQSWRRWKESIRGSAEAGSRGAAFALGLAAYHEGEFDKAVATLEPLTRDGETNAAPYLALALHLNEDNVRARATIEQAVKATPLSAASWCARATILYASDPQEAITSQTRCLALARAEGASPSDLKSLQSKLDAMKNSDKSVSQLQTHKNRTLFGPESPLNNAFWTWLGALLVLLTIGGLWWWRRRR